MRTATLHPLAQGSLNELRAQGVEPTVDEIIALHEAGRAITEASGGADRLILDQPVRCGSMELFPMTLGAMVWWTECAAVWFPAEHPLMTMAMAYAMAHSRQPAVFARLSSAVVATAEVRRWMSRLDCTRTELDAAVNCILGLAQPADSDRHDEADASWIGFHARMVDAFGAAFGEWLWQRPLELAVRILRRHLEDQGEKIPARYDPVARSVTALQRLTAEIAEAHKGAA